MLPTITVLIVFGIVERVTHQRLLFASLLSSAFLIYLDPEHPTNKIRTLVSAQLGAAIAGAALLAVIGPGYLAAAIAMVISIGGMLALDAVHPPAVSTALAFAFKGDDESNLLVFVAAVAVVAILVALEQGSLWMLRRVRGAQG